MSTENNRDRYHSVLRTASESVTFGFIEGREANGIKLKNCPAHIHEWIPG